MDEEHSRIFFYLENELTEEQDKQILLGLKALKGTSKSLDAVLSQ